MNRNEYNILYKLYKAKSPLFFRQISKISGVSIGGTQQVIKDNSIYIIKKKEGRNTYFSLKKNTETDYLKIILEIYRSIEFLSKNKLFKELFDFLNQNDMPSLIFGSYAKDSNKKESDLDVLLLSKKEVPEHISPVKIHIIRLTKRQFKKSVEKNEPLVKEIRKDHVIINHFGYFLNCIGDNYAR